MTTFYLAVCQVCTPILPQPFTDQRERAAWVTGHAAATGHRVTLSTEVRP